MNQIYLGYDSREDLAYQVASQSLLRRTTTPLKITPLNLKDLGILTRPIEFKEGKMWCPISQAPMSTEFAISRFCVPFLQSRGWALFADCDILCLSDINKLFSLADPQYAVMVVKHRSQGPVITEHGEHHGIAGNGALFHSECELCRKASLLPQRVPAEAGKLQSMAFFSPDTQYVKMDGQIQTFYNRKNWSSVVLWNMDHLANTRLTLEALNTWPGRDLHAFQWLKDEEIGELPVAWNYLVDITSPKPESVKLAHYTLGTPNLSGYENCDMAQEWFQEASLMKEYGKRIST